MSQPTGLYGWIRSNDGRSTGLFLGFLVAVQAIAAMVLFLPLTVIDSRHAPFLGWSGYFARYAPLVLAASIVWFGWQLFWHIEAVKRAVGFRFIDDAEEPRLCRVIEPLILTLGLPVPFVGVIESDARNAFACGIARKKAVVVVTRGLINDLSNEELACVLGHELSHIKNGDIRLMAAANIFMMALTKLHKNNPLKFTPIHVVLAVAVPAILPLTLAGSFIGHLALRAGQVSRLIIASAREFIADAEAVQLTQNPAAMASALVKVEHRYRIDGARHEDDAMMIAGDTNGENATHPTMAQRIAALARTTGSMVFNAPGALPESEWDRSKSLSEARSAALLRQLPAAQILPRVRVGSEENLLGLTRNGLLMLAATVAALIVIHWSEIGNPRAIAAKFDVRPISLMLGTPISCGIGVFIGGGAECEKRAGSGAYRDFEGQRNTLVGWLADTSKQRREAGVVNADVTINNFGAYGVANREYKGQSGKLQGFRTLMTAEGDFPVAGTSSGFTSQEPDTVIIAEIDGVGCFPATLNYGEPAGHYPMTAAYPGGSTIEQLEAMAEGSLISRGRPGTLDYDGWIRSYGETREMLAQISYDMFGLPGLRRIQTAYESKGHQQMLDKIGRRIVEPDFIRATKPLALAELRAIVRSPARFVPCPALRSGALN